MKLPKNTTPIILIGDVIEKLKEIPTGRVNCIITSPPYWGQRDYGVKGQIGAEKNHKEYIKRMMEVAVELKRVLSDNGCYFLNVGDKYHGKNLQMVPFKLAAEMQNNGWAIRNVIIWHKPNHMPSPIKDRLSNTWEPVFFFVKDTGRYYSREYYHSIDEIRIEHKNGYEEPKIDLPYELSEHEFEKLKNNPINYSNGYVGKFTSAGDKKNIGASPGGRASLLKANGKTHADFYSRQRKANIIKEKELEIISYLKERKKDLKASIKEIDKKFGYKDTAGHWFRLDHGRSLPKVEDWYKLKEILNLDNRYDKIMTEVKYVLQILRKHPKGKNPGDVWSITTDKLKEAHFAIFPEELPRRVIKGFCPPDGLVLDPFAGSGTTGKVAMELGRKSIMIDINPEYEKIMLKRFINHP